MKPSESAAATAAHGARNHPTRLPSHRATVRSNAILQSRTKEDTRKKKEETRRKRKRRHENKTARKRLAAKKKQ